MSTIFSDCVEPKTLFDFGRCISYYPNAVSPNNLEAAEEFCQQKMIFSGRVLSYTSQNCNLLFGFYYLSNSIENELVMSLDRALNGDRSLLFYNTESLLLYVVS